MTVRRAQCSCGQLVATCTGEPIRISICHCYECQRRTGSAFGVQARFPIAEVAITGTANTWSRTGDSGTTAVFSSCPTCASTVYWHAVENADSIAIALGAFADPTFPAPRISVYGERGHPWVGLPEHIERG